MHTRLAGDLTRPISLEKPWREGSCYLMCRNLHTDIIVRLVDFLRSIPQLNMAGQVAYAESINAECVRWEKNLPPELQYEEAMAKIRSQHPEAFRLAARALLFRSANEFLGCTLFRPFLMQHAAPPYLQFAALDHARKMIEAMPVLVTLSNSPWVAASTFNWSSSHIFASATTFAAVFLSEYGESERAWPADELDWFSSVLFDMVDTFHLVSQGDRNYTAKVCRELLLALCNSRDVLKQRFQQRQRNWIRAATPPRFSHPILHPLPSIEATRQHPSQASQNARQRHARLGVCRVRASL